MALPFSSTDYSEPAQNLTFVNDIFNPIIGGAISLDADTGVVTYRTQPTGPSFRATSTETSVITVGAAASGGALVSNQLTNVSGERGSYNLGNAYNTSDGLFTAPVAGIYFFYGTVLYHTGSFAAGYLATMITTESLVTSATSLLVTQHGANEPFNANFPQMVQGTIQLSAGEKIGLYIMGFGVSPVIARNLSVFGGHFVQGT